MGDADVVGSGGASSLDSGDAGSLAASRALMEGGSLPPRKRLLAGLKQNGWLSTSPPPVVSPSAGGYAGGVRAQALGGDSAVRKYEDGCMGCNAVESNGLRRIKRGGVTLRLCSACTLLYSKSMFCPHCLAMYHDASLLGDPSMWLVCTRCRRSVHPECEQKQAGSAPDPASYVCLDCVNSARRQREANGVTGMRSKHSSARPVPGFHGEARTGSPAGMGGDFVSPALKKPRMSRERSSRPGEHERADGSRHRSGPDAAGGTKVGVPVPPKKPSSQPHSESASPQEAAVAARNAANAAAKVAAAAKANAAAKAAASVRAAAVAKAALEAAAHASRADAAARAELRRKLASGEARVGGGGPMRLEINVHSEPRRERSSKGEMKNERDEYVPRRTGPGSVADEELARQLHRVINSSPRISRSMAPMRRKASVKPETPSSGVSNSSADTVRVRPRTSPAEPGQGPAQRHAQVRHEQEQQIHPIRHQQTRPRSITHKEFRRIDSRVSRHEVKTAEAGNGQESERVGGVVPSGQEASLNDGGDQSAVDLASGVKNEGMDAVMFAPVGVQDDASILFEALVEGEGMHAAAGEGGQSHGRRPDYLQEILEAAVLTDSAMFHDGTHDVISHMETVRSEAETGEQGQETLAAPGLDGDANEGDAKDRDDEADEDVALGAATLGPQEVNVSTVLHDVEMKEVDGGDAPPVVEEDPTAATTSMSETRSEERPSGEPVEETITEADASQETVSEAYASRVTVSEADTSLVPKSDASNEILSEVDTSSESKPDASNKMMAFGDTGIEPMDTSIVVMDTAIEPMDTSIVVMDTAIDPIPGASNETMAITDTSFELKPDASNETMAVTDTSVELKPDASNETIAVADTRVELKPNASNETIAVADTRVELKPNANMETMAVADTSIEPQPDASNETMGVADASIEATPDASTETMVVVADTSVVAKPDAINVTMGVADASIDSKPDASNETMAVADTSIVAKPDASNEIMAVADADEVSMRNAGADKVAKTIADAILAGAKLASLVEVGVSTVSGEVRLGGGDQTASGGAATGSATEQSG